MGNLVHVVLVLLILGVILFFVAPYVPGPIMTIIFAVLAIGLLIWLLKAVGGAAGSPPL